MVKNFLRSHASALLLMGFFDMVPFVLLFLIVNLVADTNFPPLPLPPCLPTQAVLWPARRHLSRPSIMKPAPNRCSTPGSGTTICAPKSGPSWPAIVA